MAEVDAGKVSTFSKVRNMEPGLMDRFIRI